MTAAPTAPSLDTSGSPAGLGASGPGMELTTMGHATLLLTEGGRPLLATDPWLIGSVYWRSWWLERYPDVAEMAAVAAAPYVYITHSHPDHFHPPTLRRLGSPLTLHPAFPNYPVPEFLRSHGMAARTLEPCRWYSLSDQVSIMSVPTFLDDSILVIDTPLATVINANDSNPSPQMLSVIREKLVKRDRVVVLKSYSPASSAVATYRDGVRAPLRRKVDYVRTAERICVALGATHFVPFASQAFFWRQDSLWANEHKVRFEDLVAHWRESSVELCGPFVKLDLATGAGPSHPTVGPLVLDDSHSEKVRTRELEEEKFSLPDDFPERLEKYFSSVRFLRLLFRHGVGVRLTSSGSEWRYDVRRRRVLPGVADSDITISLPDKVLYEALVNQVLTDLGITMLIRVDSSVDVRRAYLAFSLMGLRDYGHAKSFGDLLRCVAFYAPLSFPRLFPSRTSGAFQQAPVPVSG
jgi:hypothetical protein